MIDPTQTLVTIGTTIATTLAAKGIEAPGKTLGQIWDIAIGNRIAAVYEKSKAKHNLNVEDFKSKLINNVSSIPKENIQDPKISIIGPALEASKYYFDEKEIRDMFANLIASSMDSTYNGLVQHSFVEIIKQLSPYDAKLFNSLKGIFNLYKDILNGYYYSSEVLPDSNLNAISLENLKKYGLIDIRYDYSVYKPKSNFLKKSELDPFQNLLRPREKYDIKISIYGYITELGKAFKKVCIKDSL